MKKKLLQDLEILQDYLSTTDIDGYMLIVTNKSDTNYYCAYNFTTNANAILARTHLSLRELELNLIQNYLEQEQRMEQEAYRNNLDRYKGTLH